MKHWTNARSLLVICCLLVLTACNDHEPERPDDAGPPAPTVSESEIAVRIGEYVERIQDEVLDSTFALPPEWEQARSGPRRPTCADLPVKGPDWGVVPARYYDINVAKKDQSKYFKAVQTWLGKNGFTEFPNSAEPSIAASAASTSAQKTLSARSADGISVRMDWDSDGATSISLVLHGPCAWPDNRASGPPPSALPSMATPSWPIQAASDELACEKPEKYAYNPKSPPYAGKGPHWIRLVEFDRSDGSYAHSRGAFIPPEWVAWVGGKAWGPVDRSRIQLVACLTATMGALLADRRVTCHFDRGPVEFTLYEATYQVSVLEAATGRQVASFSIPGTQSDQDSCPGAILYRPGDVLLTGIDIDALHGALRPLVKPAK